MGVFKKRRFFVIDSTLNQREVMPVNFNGKYTWDRKLDQGQMFFRRKYTQDVDFTNETSTLDYSYFVSLEYNAPTRCQEYIFIVEVLCGQTWGEEWRGTFTTGGGKWDKDNCRFSIAINPIDDYNCILNNLTTKYNILDNINKITTEVSIEGDYEFFSCRSATPIGAAQLPTCLDSRPLPEESWKEFFSTWQLGVVNAPEFDYVRVWIREVAVTNCQGGVTVPPTGSGWVLIQDDCVDTDTSIYARQPLASWTVLNNPEVQNGECPDLEPLAPVFFNVQRVASSTIGIRNDIIGLDFLGNTSIFPSSKTYSWWLRVPSSSVNVWSIINGAGIVISVANPTQEQFDVTYSFSAFSGAASTFYIVCNETTDCGDVIVHVKTVTARSNVFVISGKNTFFIDGPTQICPDQGEQTYTIPIEYRSGIKNNIWSFDPVRLTVQSQSLYSITVIPTGAVTVTAIANVVTAFIETDENQFATTYVKGHIRAAIHTDDIRGQIEVCTGATGVIYSVPHRFGASYLWGVTGCNIISGQGTNSIVIDFDSSFGLGETEIRVNETIDCGCNWILIADCDGSNPPYWWCFKGSGIRFDNGYLVSESIDYILSQIACENITGITSDFFEWNPQGNAPNYVAGKNYVTGLDNQVNYLSIIQKSDAKDPSASNKARIQKNSFKDFSIWLFEMFQVYWFIEGAFIRFEHISFFEEELGLDLTQAIYKEEMIKSNRYNYNTNTRPKYETFAFQESRNRDFVGDDIFYDTNCANQSGDENKIEHVIEGLSTDIQFIISSPDDIDSQGWVMLANIIGGAAYSTIIDNGELTTNPIANAPLSWANLHHAFFRHYRYFKEGYINNSFSEFLSFRNTIVQDPVILKMCCELLDFNPSDKIKSPLGELWLSSLQGTVEKAEYDLKKETLRLNIGYPY